MSDEINGAPGRGPGMSEEAAREHLEVSTQIAKRLLSQCIADGVTPAQAMLAGMLLAAFMAKALELELELFLDGCGGAFRSVEVSSHGIQ